MTQTDSKETALDVMARIKRNSREREFCLAVLDLWANVQAQGVEIESVDKFGYDPKRLTNADKAKAREPASTCGTARSPTPSSCGSPMAAIASRYTIMSVTTMARPRPWLPCSRQYTKMNKFLSSDDYDNLRAMVLWDGKTNDIGLEEVMEFLIQACGLDDVLKVLLAIKQQKEKTDGE